MAAEDDTLEGNKITVPVSVSPEEPSEYAEIACPPIGSTLNTATNGHTERPVMDHFDNPAQIPVPTSTALSILAQVLVTKSDFIEIITF